MNKQSKILLTILTIIIFLNVVFNMRAQDIAVYGVTKYDVSDIKRKVLGNNMSMVVLFLKEKIIPHKNIPYIDKYEVKLSFPNNVDIIVYENKPIGYIRYMNTFFYFDKDCYVIEAKEENNLSVPEFRGITFNKLVLNQKIQINDESILTSMLNISENIILSELPVYLVHYNNKDDIRIFLGDIEVKIGNANNIEYKFNTLKSIYEKIKNYKGILDIENAKENMADEQYIFKKLN